MVDVDPIGLDAETGQGVALGSEGLLIGGASAYPTSSALMAHLQKIGPIVPQERTTRASGSARPPQKDAPTARPQQPARPTTGSLTGDTKWLECPLPPT